MVCLTRSVGLAGVSHGVRAREYVFMSSAFSKHLFLFCVLVQPRRYLSPQHQVFRLLLLPLLLLALPIHSIVLFSQPLTWRGGGEPEWERGGVGGKVKFRNRTRDRCFNFQNQALSCLSLICQDSCSGNYGWGI